MYFVSDRRLSDTIGDSKIDIACCDRNSSTYCPLTPHPSQEEHGCPGFLTAHWKGFCFSSIQEMLAER